MGTKPVLISYRGPWQNGTAERWIGNWPRELLEHGRASVDCIIGTNGARLRSNVFGRIRGPES